MSAYQSRSDGVVPTLAFSAFPVNRLGSLPTRDGESFFARTILSFFSGLAFAFAGLGFGFTADFGEAFVTTVFLGVGFAIVFGVVWARKAETALGFGAAVAVGFGVADGNSISLLGVFAKGFSSADSSCS